MVHPVIQHVASGTLPHKLDWNSVTSAGLYRTQVFLDLFSLVRSELCVEIAAAFETLNLDALLQLGHYFQIDTVVDEWKLRCIHGLLLNGDPEVGLAEPGVDFLPVEVLLKNDRFDALGHAAKLERQVLDRRTTQVKSVKSLFRFGAHSALVDFRFVPVFEELRFLLDLEHVKLHHLLALQTVESPCDILIADVHVFNRCSDIFPGR